jgi:nitrate/nitrite-specific signal transduction histidine kinase
VRAADKLGWTAGIIYPEDNISGEYWGLVYFVLAISFIGLLILFVLSRTIIHRQLLPLRMLTHSAQQIAEGHYDVQVPESRHDDEIGRLQNDFQQMQHSLSVHMNELEQLMATMQERGEELRLAYERSRKADKMKTAFLHHMTNQMVQPTQAIYEAVLALCEPGENMKMEEVNMLAQDIQQHGETIMELLKNLLNVSEEEIGKEVGHEGK